MRISDWSSDVCSSDLGRIRSAHRGTLFLDEIDTMHAAVQAKLLRVIEEREVQPIGAAAPEPVDLRVVAATKTDLRDAVARGDFREDLYYRLHVVKPRIPPLRARAEERRVGKGGVSKC